MPATFEISGSDIIVKFQYQAPSATVQSIVGDAAEYLYSGEDFDSLSNQDKLDLVDEHVKSVIIALANTHKSQAAQVAARELEAQSEYAL